MSNLAVVWSIDKFKELEAKLVGFWAEDIWDMRNCPTNTKPYADSLIYLKFFCPSIAVNKEIKYALWRKFTTREWSSHTAHHLCCLFNWFRDDFSPTIYSLTQKSKDEWEERFIFYLTNKKNKVTIYKTRQYLTRIRGNAQYPTTIPALSCLREIYRVVSDFYDARSEYEKDIWDLDKLGIKRTLTRCVRRLNFNAIDQIWLRQIVKKYLRYCLSIYSLSYCSAVMHTLNNFSAFLNGSYPSISASIIDRSVVIDYLAHLKSKNLSPKTKDDMLIILRIFLEICSREDWAPFPKERIIHNEDLPKKLKRLPRFIPDDVLNQLFQHLGELPIHYQRMIHILYHVGMRISELLNLHYDCLMQDKEGSWWIKFYQSKFKQEHTQPITAEIANIIQAQQREVTDKRGTSEKLFPNSKGNCYQRERLVQALNGLAIKKNICDSTGKIWWFEMHQFRHTFGTRHINNGVPHHIIQRLMGHKCPDMTSLYAHIYDKTLKNEFEKTLSNRKLIDISGHIINETTAADAAELQWLKKHVDARTLPNGYCGIPIALGPCPHPNACYTCPHFRTDRTHLETHQKQLEETSKLVQISRANGWIVQIENNLQIIANLQKIISFLKEANDGASA